MPIAVSGSNIVFADGSSIASGFTGFKNRIINGDMRIDQRNNGSAVTTSGSYPVDRFAIAHSGNPTFSLQQISDAPTGFVNSVRFTTTNATGAYDFSLFTQCIEGTNISDLAWGSANAKTVTLSFWTKSSLTGTFGGALNNGPSTRLYPFTYTISAANTWEYKTVTIVGDTGGTWLTTTGRGINVRWQMGATSTYTGTNNTWQTVTEKYAAAGCVQIVETLNATWQITGVQLEVGSSATSFEYREYGAELRMCQRYFIKYLGTSTFETSPFLVASPVNTSDCYGTLSYPVQMRTKPSISTSTIRLVDQANAHTITSVATAGANYGGVFSLDIYIVASGLTAYRPYYIQANGSTNANISISAEL